MENRIENLYEIYIRIHSLCLDMSLFVTISKQIFFDDLLQ